ncbi:helix-turn-helix transcriptional regulator [Flammeovirgaceae bacterium KN852]|uniref:Helix-turn-helix transcriptional regulator n=1 Tax=Marinigracilibium pacificum TaxID=2729599 RepID=A0A848IVS1_9BACT|nr:helix-turn-helix transcriptional regulator [Marinigracilibium pacificum]
MVDIYRYFKSNPDLNKVVGNNYLFVEYKCPLDVEDYKFWSDSHMITYVISGKKDWISKNNVFQITGGDALFIKKGVYQTKQYFDVDYCVMMFLLNDDFIAEFIREYQNNYKKKIPKMPICEQELFRINTGETIESLIISVFNYLKQAQTLPQELIEIKFKELLINILIDPKNSSLTNFLLTCNQSAKADMESTMLNNFTYDLSIEEFARLCGRSLSTFKRDFKKYYGDTPANWLKAQRLTYAISLMQNPDLSIGDICYESGFKNLSHFNKVFKEKFNLPPGQYRSNLQKMIV